MLVYSYHPKKADFTCWNVEISYEPYDEYRRYKVYNYIKVARYNNESELPEDALENIKCVNKRRNHSESVLEWIVDDVFRFGKYKYSKIKEVKDVPYTAWYWGSIEKGSHRDFVKEFLYDNWYEFRVDENGNEKMITPKEIKRENEINEKLDNFLDNFDCSKTYYLEPKSNPNENGEIKIDGITYTFPKVKEFYYDGYYYYLPLCNGKAKRIKNKVLECRLMYFDNKIFVSNFKTIK